MDIHIALETLAKDVRYAIRGLRKTLSFTVPATIALGLGIGANAAIFSVVNGVLIKPLPYPDSDRLVSVEITGVFQSRRSRTDMSPGMYASFRENNRSFMKIGIWRLSSATITGQGEPEQVQALVVTDGTLPALGVRPARGRWFSHADDTAGTAETIMLTNSYWRRRFGSDNGIVGKTIIVDSRPREVIGVMPQSFRFLNRDPDVLLPQRFDLNELQHNDVYGYAGIARLRPGVTVAQANADVVRMLPIWAAATHVNLKTFENAQFAPGFRPLKEEVVGNVGRVLWLLTGAVGLILMIACANVANLLLVRARSRQQELAIRAALGAGWGRITRELLIESTAVGMIGGGLGLVFAFGALRLLVSMGPVNLPRLAEISIDPAVVAFTLLISLLSGALFGLIPVLKYAGPRIALEIRGARAATQSREHYRSQNTLVVLQVALALILLVRSGLMIRTFHALHVKQPGFIHPERVQTVRISIPESQVDDPSRVIRMQNDILDKIAAIPGVVSAAFTTAMPMEVEFRSASPITAEDKPVLEGQIPPVRVVRYVSPGVFSTQGTPLIAGRDLTWADIHNKREVALVSENVARETWGEPLAALGKRIRVVGDWREVIGVVGDVFDDGVHKKAPGIVYWRAGVQPAGQRGFPPVNQSYVPRSVTFAIRSDRTGTEGLLKDVRDAVWSVNPNLPLASVRTLATVYDRSMAETSFTLVMLGIAGFMALALGLVGIYGVISYTVSQQKRSIAIRAALGAQQHELRRMFVRRGAILPLAGLAIGLGVASVLTRVMSALLFRVKPLDALTYCAAAFILGMAAVLASYVPARRASRVDPMEALKAE